MTHSTTNSDHSSAPIIVVRHGESEWNVLGKWQGRADTNLTDAGRRQALDAARHLATSGIAIDRVVASSLRRASETAAIIAAHLGLAVPEVDDRLVETDVGPWEGLREHEIEAAWPNYLAERRTPPNFEAPLNVFARATSALCEHALRGDRTLVVSHSGVIRTLRRVMNAHDRRLHNLEGCFFTVSRTGVVAAGDFIALAAAGRATTNDSV